MLEEDPWRNSGFWEASETRSVNRMTTVSFSGLVDIEVFGTKGTLGIWEHTSEVLLGAA